MNRFPAAIGRPGWMLKRQRARPGRRPEFEVCEDRKLLAISINDVSLLEGNSGTTSFVFTLSLDSPESYPFTVELSTRDGTALAGEDYVPLDFETVNFAIGQISATVTVEVIGDLIREPDEFFYVDIVYSGNDIITDGEGLGIIANDDFLSDLVLTHAAFASFGCLVRHLPRDVRAHEPGT